MKIAIKFFEKEFKSEESKNAYLKACKWVAKNIISKVEIGETFWNINKVENASLPTFKLELYCMLDESEFRQGFCDKCQQFHKAFYINQFYNCNRCNMKTYTEYAESKLIIKKTYRKERLDYILNKK